MMLGVSQLKRRQSPREPEVELSRAQGCSQLPLSDNGQVPLTLLSEWTHCFIVRRNLNHHRKRPAVAECPSLNSTPKARLLQFLVLSLKSFSSILLHLSPKLILSSTFCHRCNIILSCTITTPKPSKWLKLVSANILIAILVAGWLPSVSTSKPRNQSSMRLLCPISGLRRDPGPLW
jgi:hypothetical protein